MINKINSILSSIGVTSKIDENSLICPIEIKNTNVILRITTHIDGAVVSFEIIGLIPPEEVRNSEHTSAFVSFVMAHNWQTAAGSCELDHDGELRVVVELPMADAQPTENQIKLVLKLLRSHATAVLTDGCSILRTGMAAKTDEEPLNEAAEDSDQTRALMVKMQELAETAEGRSQLVTLASTAGLPDEIRQLAAQALAQCAPDSL